MQNVHILELIRQNVERFGAQPCLHYKDQATKSWKYYSWDQMWAQVEVLAKGLIAMQLKKGDRVAIFSASRVEWTLADLAVLAAGGITIPIYHSLTTKQVEDLLKDSGVTLAFVEGKNEYQKIRAISAQIVCIPFDHPEVWGSEVSLRRLQKISASVEVNAVEKRMQQIDLEDPASFVYTSGTTGRQKGVVLRHRHFLAEVEAVKKIVQFSSQEIGMICLPLPHVLTRVVQFYQLVQGCQTAFAENLDRLASNLQEIRPHFICVVPRILEKTYARLQGNLREVHPLRQQLFAWALRAAERRENLLRKHEPVSRSLRLQYRFARDFVFSQVRARMGGNLRTFISGGAALNRELAHFFHLLGFQVLEGYGLTETCAAITLNTPSDHRFGTVGKPLPGVQLRISDDGEIQAKGDMIFDSYYNLPEETAAAFNQEGWFCTGDVGEFTKDGFVRITGRKKDLLITSAGKNIAPQPIEQVLEESPYIDNAMLYGDGHNYITALLALNREAIMNYAGKQQIAWSRYEELLKHQRIHQLIEAEVARVNQRLASFETVKKFVIARKPLTIEGGELTPTLKVRRHFTSQKYRATLEALYEETAPKISLAELHTEGDHP